MQFLTITDILGQKKAITLEELLNVTSRYQGILFLLQDLSRVTSQSHITKISYSPFHMIKSMQPYLTQCGSTSDRNYF